MSAPPPPDPEAPGTTPRPAGRDRAGPDLFLCYTPLQALIARRIIATRQLAPEDCVLLFMVDQDNAKMRLYFGKLGSLCAESHFQLLNRQSLVDDLVQVRRRLAGRRFASVFLANTNQPTAQVALSTIRFDDLYTFDDGTSNLAPDCHFTRPIGMGPRRFLTTLLLGNRYYQGRIRRLAKRHFTVFAGMPNNTLAPLEPVALVAPGEGRKEAPDCTLLLGTVERELTGQADGSLAAALARLAATLEGEVWYLPHPRGEAVPALEARTLHSEQVAEDVIIDLLQRYARVNLYGFGSATQMVFLAEPRVRNVLLRPAAMKPALRGLVEETARRYGIPCIDL